MFPQYTYLRQIFCDGSIVNYCEERASWPGAPTELTRWGDGHREKIQVTSGYIAAKIDLLNATGNSHKILKRH